MTLRWGLLSTAKINERFLAGCADSDQMEVAAVASRDAERARRYADEHGIGASHGSYEALLEDPGVDAVYISLPNGLHLEWTERALRAGKHVLCEKPLGRDPVAVAAAFDLAGERGLVLMEAFMYRHHPQTRRLTELVADGAIGALRLVRSTFSFPLRDPTDARLSRALDGGALMDVGCYCVSASRLLAGEPVQVGAQYRLGGDGVDVGLVGSLRFENGALGLIDCGFDCAARGELEVVGEDATLFVGDPWHCRTPGIERRSAAGVERFGVPAADSYRLQAEQFGAAVRREAEPLLDRADAIGQAATIAALYAAAESGRSEAPARG